MPRRVDPHQYVRETPIFAKLLQDRDGRYPGTPEGEEDIHIELEAPVLPTEPTEPDMSSTMLNRLFAVKPLSAVVPVTPIFEDDPHQTQPMRLPEL